MTDECPEAIVLLCLQTIVGVLVEALMVGVVLVKLSSNNNNEKFVVKHFYPATNLFKWHQKKFFKYCPKEKLDRKNN